VHGVIAAQLAFVKDRRAGRYLHAKRVPSLPQRFGCMCMMLGCVYSVRMASRVCTELLGCQPAMLLGCVYTELPGRVKRALRLGRVKCAVMLRRRKCAVMLRCVTHTMMMLDCCPPRPLPHDDCSLRCVGVCSRSRCSYVHDFCCVQEARYPLQNAGSSQKCGILRGHLPGCDMRPSLGSPCQLSVVTNFARLADVNEARVRALPGQLRERFATRAYPRR
jgi:hypothetical protein